jgi:hypothetical protein
MKTILLTKIIKSSDAREDVGDVSDDSEVEFRMIGERNQDNTSSAYLAEQIGNETLNTLNFSRGMGASVFDRIAQSDSRRKGQARHYEEIRELREKRKQGLKQLDINNKRVTAGLLVNFCFYSVNKAAPHIQAKIVLHNQNKEESSRQLLFRDYRNQ